MVRVVAAIAIAVVALFALYLVSANVLIRTRMLRSLINDGPDKTRVEYTSAYTLWPGRAHVTGLRIWDRDKAAEWRISFDEADATIGLLGLLGNRLHTTSLQGRGLSIRIRSRLKPDQATPREISLLPPIPELPGPPVRNPGAQETRSKSDPWSVLLDGIAVDEVKEIWVDDYHFAGRAGLTGGFHLVPRKTLEVPSTTLDVREGSLRYRGQLAAADLQGRVEAALDERELPSMHDGDVLKFMTGMGRVNGRIDGAQVLDEVLGIAPHVRFHEGRGALLAELSLDHGRGTGHLDFTYDEIRATTDGLTLDGRAEGSVRLASMDLHESVADFSGSRLHVRDVVVTGPSGKARPWWMRLELGRGRLGTDQPRIFRTSVSVTARDARPLYRLLNTGLPHWAEGILELESMNARAHVALGSDYLEVESLEADGDEYRIEGRFRRRGVSKKGVFLISHGHADLAAALEGGATTLKLFRSEKWFHERLSSF